MIILPPWLISTDFGTCSYQCTIITTTTTTTTTTFCLAAAFGRIFGTQAHETAEIHSQTFI